MTGIVQNGSLPVYSGVILATAAIFPIVALTSSWDWPGWPTFGTVGDVPVAGVLLVAAMGAATVRRRFSAALFLGGAGYAMAGLFVAYGAPKQDKWIARNRDMLTTVRVAVGVGGSLDFITGRAVRAPQWAQDAGLEWLHRLYREPWRWRRMLALPRFALRVIFSKA